MTIEEREKDFMTNQSIEKIGKLIFNDLDKENIENIVKDGCTLGTYGKQRSKSPKARKKSIKKSEKKKEGSRSKSPKRRTRPNSPIKSPKRVLRVSMSNSKSRESGAGMLSPLMSPTDISLAAKQV